MGHASSPSSSELRVTMLAEFCTFLAMGVGMDGDDDGH
jgi:hypothetical protein